MKLSSIVSEKEMSRFVAEAPMLGATTPGAAPATGAAPTQAPVAGANTLAPGQQIQQDPQAQAKMLAQQALDRQNQKKQIQDEIKQTQDHLADLQKQLAAIK